MEDSKRPARRRHDADLKRQVLEECAVPGASVARVAMSHGLNSNLVHKWRRAQAGKLAPAATVAVPSQFLPIALAAPAAPSNVSIERKQPAKSC